MFIYLRHISPRWVEII